MPYLIDGHNLIPKIPGLSLEDPDDEQRLLEMLGEFCRKTRKQAEVFFDKASPDGVRAHNLGLLTARFIRQGTTADEAIRQKLLRLGREAHNWTVVSSDQAVQGSARASQAHYISSDAFTSILLQAVEAVQSDPGANTDAALSQDEVNDWLKLFGEKGNS
jgi:uncharacterized protein